MALLVRKISRRYWPSCGTSAIDVFDQIADGITNCLRTSGNTLSVWEIGNWANLDDAVLAMVSGFKTLDIIDVVALDPAHLSAIKITQKKTPGKTPVKSLVNTHIDLENLNYLGIGLVAEHIIFQISKSQIKRYTIADVKNIVNTAIASGRLAKSDLQPTFAAAL